MWDPVGTQNFLRVPSSRISALCLPPLLATPTDDDWAQNGASQPMGQSDFGVVDGSGQIFSMYLEMAEEEDKKMTESWKADAEGVLVFVRLCFLVLYFKLTPIGRLVYSPLLSPLYSRCRSGISNRTRRTRPISTLPIYTSFLPTPILAPIDPIFPLSFPLPRLRFLRRASQFG